MVHRCEKHKDCSYLEDATEAYLIAVKLDEARFAAACQGDLPEQENNDCRKDVQNVLLVAQTAALIEIATQLQKMNGKQID